MGTEFKYGIAITNLDPNAGGGSDPKLFGYLVFTDPADPYADNPTYEEVEAALEEYKFVRLQSAGDNSVFAEYVGRFPDEAEGNHEFHFIDYIQGLHYILHKTNDVWEVKDYPSRLPVASTFPSRGMSPDAFYNLGTITADPNITLAAGVAGYLNEYKMQFKIGSGWTPAVTFPASVVFPDTPTWEEGKTYQVSIVNNLALVAAWTE